MCECESECSHLKVLDHPLMQGGVMCVPAALFLPASSPPFFRFLSRHHATLSPPRQMVETSTAKAAEMALKLDAVHRWGGALCEERGLS